MSVDSGSRSARPVCLWIARLNHNIGLWRLSLHGLKGACMFSVCSIGVISQGFDLRSLLIFHVDCVESRSWVFYWRHMLRRAVSSRQP